MKIEEIKKKAKPILDEYGVSKAAIFGSYAHGDLDQDSDIDIAVKIDSDLSLLDFIALKQDLEDALGKSVDLVEYSKIKPRLKQYIMEKQVAIS